MLSVAVWRPQADFLISLGNLLSPGYANVSLLSLVHSAAGLAVRQQCTLHTAQPQQVPGVHFFDLEYLARNGRCASLTCLPFTLEQQAASIEKPASLDMHPDAGVSPAPGEGPGQAACTAGEAEEACTLPAPQLWGVVSVGQQLNAALQDSELAALQQLCDALSPLLAAYAQPLLDLVSNLMCAKPALEPKAPDCEPEPEPKPEAAPKKDVCCAPEGKPDDNPDAGGSAPSIRSSSSPLNTREEDRTADLLLYGLPPGDARVDPAAASPQAHEAAANAAAGAAAKCPVHGGRAPEGAGHGGSALPPPGAKQAPCWQYPCQACYEGRKQHPVWLHFKSIRLEEKFRLWHAQQLWKIDIIYNIIWFVLFLATSFTKPISLFARRPWAWLFAFPHMSSVIVMGINPRYYPQRREKAIMVVLIWTALYCTYVACPNMMATVPLERLQNATWQVRIIGAEALAVQPLGNKMRFWVFIPVQLTAVALASHGLRAACTSTWPAAAMSLCMSVNAAALFVVGFCMPAAAIWFLERRSRAIFLASPAATST